MSLFRSFRDQPGPGPVWLQLARGPIRVHLAPNRRARRYILRLRPGVELRVTIPRGGSPAEAMRFAERCRPWIERQLLRQAARPAAPSAWRIGTTILFRGELSRFEAAADGSSRVRLGPELIPVADTAGDFRGEAERHLWRIAGRELPPRVAELAAGAVPVRRVSVRNQRSRWGSCSRRGTVSLNWRLIQAPPFVRDYIIHHELAHLREMNHSTRFWSLVHTLCPDYATAERWLKRHSSLLR